MVAYKSLKRKGKVQLGNPKSGRGRLQLLFITKYKLQFKRGFTRVVVTRAGRLRDCATQSSQRLPPPSHNLLCARILY